MYILFNKKKTIIFVISAIIFIISLSLIGIYKSRQSQETLSWSLASQTIVIDAGHGGIFPGKISPEGVQEKNINLAIAQKLQALLVESGTVTVMTRQSDDDLVPSEQESDKLILRQRADLGERTHIAAASGANLFISIHCNSVPATQWHGAQTFYAPQNETSAQLAHAIQASLIKQLKNTDRQAIVRQDTYLFQHLDIPAVIVECGFLSNPSETALLQQDAYQQKIAYAIFCGISDFLDQQTTKP